MPIPRLYLPIDFSTSLDWIFLGEAGVCRRRGLPVLKTTCASPEALSPFRSQPSPSPEWIFLGEIVLCRWGGLRGLVYSGYFQAKLVWTLQGEKFALELLLSAVFSSDPDNS